MMVLRCSLILLLSSGCFMKPDLQSESSNIPPKIVTPEIIDSYKIDGNGMYQLLVFDLAYQDTKGDSVFLLGLAFRSYPELRSQVLLALPDPNGRSYWVQRFEYDNGLAVRARGSQVNPLLTVGIDELIFELLKK